MRVILILLLWSPLVQAQSASAASTPPSNGTPAATTPAPSSAPSAPATQSAGPPSAAQSVAPTPLSVLSPTAPSPDFVPGGLPPTDKSFLGIFPQLKSYLYEEPPSGIFLGAGGSPIGVVGSSMMFTANFFELHWIKDRYDIELLNASYSFTRAQSSEFQATYFTFRASPKYRFFGVFSAGPLIGYELVSYPNVGARIYRLPYIQPESEPFSSQGWIYGVEVCETFNLGSKYLFKISEIGYKETYSATTTPQGWAYYYDDPLVRQDVSNVSAGTVIMLQMSFLY